LLSVLQPLVDFMNFIINGIYALTAAVHVPSYGLAIIIFTVLLKIALYPLTVKQMKSMVVMQRLAPQVKEIQAKYKQKDPKMMQQKIMELYSKNNANPMSGCLPLLIQMPVLFALFYTLRNFNYVGNAGFLWIPNLSEINNYLYILPILCAVSTYIQSMLTVNSTDQTQKIMLYVMPVMIGYFATQVPAGLALYWVVFNILGIVQQYYINKKTLLLKEAIPEGANKGANSRKNR